MIGKQLSWRNEKVFLPLKNSSSIFSLLSKFQLGLWGLFSAWESFEQRISSYSNIRRAAAALFVKCKFLSLILLAFFDSAELEWATTTTTSICTSGFWGLALQKLALSVGKLKIVIIDPVCLHCCYNEASSIPQVLLWMTWGENERSSEKEEERKRMKEILCQTIDREGRFFSLSKDDFDLGK